MIELFNCPHCDLNLEKKEFIEHLKCYHQDLVDDLKKHMPEFLE